MTVNIFNANDNTNSSTTCGWKITANPFIAYRAEGTAHYGFQACSPNFEEEKFTKILTTKKGTKLLINVPTLRDDEEIFLVHLTGGFRGDFEGRWMSDDINEVSFGASYKHCNPSMSAVFILNNHIKSEWFYIAEMSGRYNPYYYIFNKSNVENPLIIKSEKEFESWCDINEITIEDRK